MAKKIRIIPWLDESQLNKQLNRIGKKSQKVKVDIDGQSINTTNQNLKNLNKTANTTNGIFNKMRSAVSNIFSEQRVSMAAYLMILREINVAANQAKETIKEMDSAVTDLSIAMNSGRERATSYLGALNKQAIELKTTTGSVAEAADSWLRQGKSISDTETLIRDSLVLSKVGKIDSADSTDYLTSALNGYKLEAKDAISVIDKLTAVDAESASEAGGLALSMSRTASAADMAGVSMNRLIGWLATVKEVTRDSDEAVGNMTKTMLSRMNQVKAGKFIDEETGESLNDMEKVLNKVGIAMRDTEGQFRSSEIVLDELGQKFNDLDTVTQRAVATALGGTYQYEKVIALLSNYSKAMEYSEVAANSAGSAMEKFENSYLDSLEAREAALQSTFEGMIMNTDMDEVYADILDATTAMIEFLDATNAIKGSLAGLAVAGGIKAFLGIKSGVMEAYVELNKFHNALKIVKQTKISTKDFNKLLLLSNNLSKSQMKLLLSSKNLTNAQREQILVNSGLSKAEAKVQLQTMGLATAQTGLTAATTTLRNAFGGLMATMAANPIFLITTAVSGAVMAYNSYKQKIEETRQANIEASETAIESANSLRELYQEYSRLNSIQSRTVSEEEEYKSVIEDISVILGNRTEALKGLSQGTEEYTKKLEELTKAELREQYTSAVVGRKSAEEEFKEAIWNDWSLSKVTVDSNNKGKSLSEDAQAAVNIVSDALKEYQTINQTWKNISWDIKSDDPENAIEYYGALLKAREELVAGASENEALLDTEIYKDINNAISTMSDKIDSYVSKRYEELKLDYLINNQIPTTVEEYKKLEESITSVAGENEHLKQSFLDLLTKDYSGLISQAPEVPDITDGVEKSTEVTYSFSYEKLDDIPRKLSEIESAYKTATDALAEYDEKGYYSMETIDAIIGLENEYISALINSEGQIQISKESINNLAEIKLEASKASLYQEACEELVRIKTLDTALAAQELALINGTLTQSAYETAKALYEEVSAMGGANAALAGKVWDATTAKVALLDNQIASLKSNTYSVGKAVGDSGKSSVKVLEAELDALDASMEAGYIDFSDYIGKRKALIDDYYNQGKIKAADYYNYLKGHYEQELKYYNSALKAITNLLDSEIDSWKKKIDEVETENDFLNSKLDDYNGILDVVNDVYDTEIEGLQKEQSLLQDKIDAIHDTNDALDEQKRKEEAIYALRRAEENRVKKVYVGSEQGFIYTEDHSAVREAQDNLHEIETEEAISKIEDEINNYQKLIDQLEDFKGKWNEVLDAHTNSVNRQLAISLWGQNYENVILSNRISDIETFKNGYVSIQEQINSNESLINSYNEKIEYYSALKNEWSSISTAREIELERQHAADILGQNWEAEVLSGRTDNLNKFKTAYISIQQALADAAWNSANEQIKAAKEAAKAAQGSYGSAGSVGNTDAYEVVYEDGAETVKVFDNREEAQEYADKMSEGIDENEPSYYVKKLPTHHDGLKSGLVGAKNNNDNFSVLEKWGLKKGEVPEILKRGEAVLNQMQIDNVAYPLRMFGDLVKVTSPDTSYMKNIQNNRNVEQSITINNSFPNVNNETGYDNFSKHMSRFVNQLYLDTVQYTHRR